MLLRASLHPLAAIIAAFNIGIKIAVTRRQSTAGQCVVQGVGKADICSGQCLSASRNGAFQHN